MLKQLDNFFEKKKNILRLSQDKTGLIKQSLKSFIEKKFNGKLKGFLLELSYDSKDNSLIVIASSKVIASELVFQLADLHEALKNDGIKLSRILIR